MLSGVSPEDALLPPPWTPASLSFVLFFELLLLPKQQIMEHKKLDRFFGGSVIKLTKKKKN